MIAGAVAGLSGAMFGIFNRGLFPDFLYWTKGAEILIMVVLGGMNRFLGPMLGAAIILTLHQEITAYTEYWSLVLAAILAVLVITAPDGVLGLLERGLRRLIRRPPGPVPRASETAP